MTAPARGRSAEPSRPVCRYPDRVTPPPSPPDGEAHEVLSGEPVRPVHVSMMRVVGIGMVVWAVALAVVLLVPALRTGERPRNAGPVLARNRRTRVVAVVLRGGHRPWSPRPGLPVPPARHGGQRLSLLGVRSGNRRPIRPPKSHQLSRASPCMRQLVTPRRRSVTSFARFGRVAAPSSPVTRS